MSAVTILDYVRILPELTLALFGVLIMVADPLLGEKRARPRA